MKIHRLDFRIEWVSLLDQRFDFLVDDQLMRELVGATNPAGVPLWLTKPEYPRMPNWTEFAGRFLYSVCGCGEWGCGADTCGLATENNMVVMNDFDGAAQDSSVPVLNFELENYEFVVQSFRDHGKLFLQLCQDYQAVSDVDAEIVDLFVGKFRLVFDGEDDYQKRQVIGQIKQLLDPVKVQKTGSASVARRMMSNKLAEPALQSLLEECGEV